MTSTVAFAIPDADDPVDPADTDTDTDTTPPGSPQAAPPLPAPTGTPLPVRFNPATRVLWRSSSELQLELGERRMVVSGLSERVVDDLGRACASVSPPDDDGVTEELAELVRTLDRMGFLSRPGGGSGGVDPDWTPARPMLGADVRALAERFGDDAPAVLGARAQRIVTVEGAGRLPAMIAALLAAAGVGHVHVSTDGEVGLPDAAPGGLAVTDEGRRRSAAGAEAVTRAAPTVDTRWVRPGDADFVVLAGVAPVSHYRKTALLIDGVPHLNASVWAASTVVGPLVVPGRTSCLMCADHHRSDRDPAWPALAAQLATITSAPSDVTVCALAAAVAAVQILAYLDGDPVACIDGTLELALPDWRLRRRSWSAHRLCPCRHGSQSSAQREQGDGDATTTER